jgi:hypothetical protein
MTARRLGGPAAGHLSAAAGLVAVGLVAVLLCCPAPGVESRRHKGPRAPPSRPRVWDQEEHEGPVDNRAAPPIPSPPDAHARLAELWSYRAGSCNGTVATVTDAQFVFGVVARGEAPYIEEWVLYHLFIGVDLIYLYDNEDEPTYHRLFGCNPRVRVVPFPNTRAEFGMQTLGQLHFVQHFNPLHTWAMLPNADEFIVLKKVCTWTSGCAGAVLEIVPITSYTVNRVVVLQVVSLRERPRRWNLCEGLVQT